MTFLLLTCKAFSQDGELLTIEQAIEIALQNNYSINIAGNQKEISDNNLSIGNAGFLPTLDADASYSKSISDTKQNFFDGRVIDRTGAKATNMFAGISLNWTIFDGFEMFASLDQLKELKKVGEINFKSQVENNIADILNSYYNIVREIQVIEALKKSVSISEERVKIAESKKEVGSGSKFELLQAQVDLNEDRSSLLHEELILSQAKILVNQLLGRSAEIDFSVIDTIIINDDLAFEDIQSLADENNSELKIAEQNRNIAEIDLALARSELFPEIDVNVGYGYTKLQSQAGFISSNRNNQINYGVTASFNLFNGLNTRLRIENAHVSIESSKLSYEETRNNINASLLNSFKRYQNSLQQVELEKENLKAAEENVGIAFERLRLGNITPFEFREVQTQLFEGKSRLVTAQFEAKSAETELLRLGGKLIESK